MTCGYVKEGEGKFRYRGEGERAYTVFSSGRIGSALRYPLAIESFGVTKLYVRDPLCTILIRMARV